MEEISPIEKKSFTITDKVNNKCTATCFGNDKIKQEGYHCHYCDSKRLFRYCSYCYYICHGACRKEELSEKTTTKRNDNKTAKSMYVFACDCSIKQRHSVKTIKKNELVACQLSAVDKSFLSNQLFYCNEDQMNLCSMCYFICHKDCINKQQTDPMKSNQLDKNRNSGDQLCNCTDGNHTLFNEFTFQIPIFDYQSNIKASFWPIQLLNLMFSSGTIFQELKLLFRSIITGQKDQSIIEEEHRFPYLLELFSNMFNRKFKTLYYHQAFNEMFPFDQLVSFMKNLRCTTQETALIKFRLMFVLLFVHLKRDFSAIKTYTSIDFMTNSIFERLKFRAFLFQKSSYTKSLHDKYKITENNAGILKEIALEDFCPFMEIVIRKNLVNILEFQDEMEIGLKFVCFMLKKMLFSRKDLKKLIGVLFLFHIKFINSINLKDEDSISSWLELFVCFSEILLMICVNYNDLVIDEYLTTGKFKHNFIHSRSEHSKLLFLMIIKNTSIVTHHFLLLKKKNTESNKSNAINDNQDYQDKIENDEDAGVSDQIALKKKRINPNGVPFKKPENGILYDKVIKLFHESLKMFTLTNNNYLYQIESMTKDHFITYLDQIKAIHLLEVNASISHEINPALQMHHNIERVLHNFFLSSNKKKKIKEFIHEIMMNFVEFIETIQNRLSEFILNVHSNSNSNSNSNMKYCQMINLYYSDVNIFFIDNESHFNYDKLTTELCYSNIDDTCLKTLVFLSDRHFPKMATFQLFHQVLSFLSLFLYTESGLRYLLSGKTLGRLNKLFHRYSFNKTSFKGKNGDIHLDSRRFTHEIIKFIYLLIKGAHIYKLNLKEHKVLLRLKKNLISHLIEYHSNDNNDLQIKIELKQQLIFCLKILNYLSPFYEQNDIVDIIDKLTLIIFDQKYAYFDSTKFYNHYSQEVNEKRHLILGSNTFLNNESNAKKLNSEEMDYEEKKKLLLNENIIEESKKTNNIPIKQTKIKIMQSRHKTESLNSLNQKDKEEITLYYSFLKLYTQRLNTIEDINYIKLNQLNDIFDFEINKEKTMKTLFIENKLGIKERIILLNAMRRVFFIDRTSSGNTYFIKEHLTGKEYLSYIIENKINEYPSISKDLSEKYSEIEMKEIELKYQILKRIEMFVMIYINEINSFPDNIEIEKPSKIRRYTRELLFGIRQIADFFYLERNLWNHLFIYFYNLSNAFLNKIDVFIETLTQEDKNFLISKSDLSPRKKKKTVTHKTKAAINLMNDASFDMFNRDAIYRAISESLERVFQKTNTTFDFSLSSYLDTYDTTQELNFTPVCLLEVKDYEYFYEEKKLDDNIEIIKDPSNSILEFIKVNYINLFLNLKETSFSYVIQGVSNNITGSHSINHLINYLKSYLYSGIFDDTFDSLLCIVTKMAFYNTTETQKAFKKLISINFFIILNRMLQKEVYYSFITCKNIYDNSRFVKLTNMTKLTLQLIQLLGENFSTNFHEAIFHTEKSNNNPSIFENVMKTLQRTIEFINLSKDIEAELPYDKLIVLASNLIDFIVEFLVSNPEYSKLIEKEIDNLLFLSPKMIDFLGERCQKDSLVRTKIISYIKVKLSHLLISFIQSGKEMNTIKKMIDHNWTSIDLFNELLYNFMILVNNLNKSMPQNMTAFNQARNVDAYIKALTNLYVNESKFRETLELTFCFQLFIIIKILETKYGKTELSRHFTKLRYEEEKKQRNLVKGLKIANPIEKSEDSEWTVNSKQAFFIYRFMEQVVLSVEIKTTDMIDFSKEEKSDGFEDENSNINITFFVRPYLTYFISKQSITSFEANVDRSSATSKYLGLINATDYFMFEMVVNRNISNGNNINRMFCDFEFTIFERVNFLMIVIHNILLIANNYKSWKLSNLEYNTARTDFYEYKLDTLILAIIQIVYLFIVLIIWFKFKFLLYYQSNILRTTNTTFIFRKKQDCGQKKLSKRVQEFFSDCNKEIWVIIKDINNSISLMSRVYNSLVRSILLNREICLLVYTIVLLILYFATKSSVFIVIPILFVANISPTLFAIFKAVKNKLKALGTILLFTYLIVYIFMWITYYFLADNFQEASVFDRITQTSISESFCYSSVQCWMILISYGIRSGGGIGDVLGMVSFKTDYKYFILRFFYDMFFHLFIVLILLNVFLGIIVDAFGELRNQNWQRENDIKSICFICQLSSDDCVTKNIDFNEHIHQTHYLWNYVYFLTYLHLGNANDFNRIQKYVWDKLGNQDYSWIPIEQKKSED